MRPKCSSARRQNSPGRTATRRRIDDDEAIELGRHQLLRQPDAARSDIEQLHRRTRHAALRKTSQQLDRETVVPPKDVTESGD